MHYEGGSIVNNLMGIINLSENEEEIKEITYDRPIATIPIAGRYRVVDFILSNMVNAGINNISIFTQGKSRSLMDHIGTGKSWDLDRKNDGIFVLNPKMNINDLITHKGDIENFKNHLDYLYRSKQEYVFITRSFMICNIDLNEAFAYHRKSGADITIIYKSMINNHGRFMDSDTLNMDENGNVISIGRNAGNKREYNMSLEMYLLKKDLLIEIIQDSISSGENEYLRQAMLQNIKTLNVNAYPFEGYVSCINSIKNYYESNMDLLELEVSEELFGKNRIIYTKVKDEPPTKYSKGSDVTNSLIANGCVIEGTVMNSVIGRGVNVEKGAVIKDSIIMQKSTIGKDAYLNNTILDKYVQVVEGKILSGDRRNPLVIRKGLRI